jgi:hypothetical protein
MKKNIIVLLSLMLGVYLLPAQTWKEKLEAMERRVENKMENQQKTVDLQFANQMRRVWKDATLSNAIDPPPVPKPVNPQIYDPSITPKGRTTELIIIPEQREAPRNERIDIPAPREIPNREVPSRERPDLTPEPAPRAEVDPAAEERTSESAFMEDKIEALGATMDATFYGADLYLRYDRGMAFKPLVYINENQIADAWEQLENTNYEIFLYQLERYASRYNLNDWGYVQLVNTAAKRIFPRDANSRTIFNWFCLSQSGYIATVCYTSNNLYLMMPSTHTLYGRTYLKGKHSSKYYVFDLEGGKPRLNKVRVFNNQFPKATKKLNFELNEVPRLSHNVRTKELKLDYNGKRYRIPVSVNENLLEFYDNYPFMDLSVYMQAPLSTDARAAIIPALKKITREMSEQEAANFLLAFVQNSFKYKTDREQFGTERYLFAEETLFYPYSDCEDRSVLYAYLVQEILGLEVVGLIFPGHAATAVRFSGRVDGDYITYMGRKYIICDPTYINADIGMLLPQYKSKTVQVIKI